METLSQLAQLVLFISASVITIEAALYWFLAFHGRRIYWPASALGGGLLAALVGWSSGTAAYGGYFFGAWLLAAAYFRFVHKGRFRLAIMMLAPAFVAICLLIVYPFFFELNLAFHKLNLYTINKWIQGGDLKFVGLDNFIAVFTTSPLQTATFWDLLVRTFLWTGINLVFHVSGGLALAMLLHKVAWSKGIYRTLLIIPWAMPQLVAVLAWRGEFHPQFGMINQLLATVGIEGIGWWSERIPVFISCCIVNIWLGIPFMMIVFLGGLQAISRSYYEAADIDGASRWQKFREITVPLLKPTVVPSITLGTIWTFNNINVIYLMSGGNGGSEYADILISALYKASFTYARYSFSAAFAVIIFLLLLAITLTWVKLSKGTESYSA